MGWSRVRSNSLEPMLLATRSENDTSFQLLLRSSYLIQHPPKSSESAPSSGSAARLIWMARSGLNRTGIVNPLISVFLRTSCAEFARETTSTRSHGPPAIAIGAALLGAFRHVQLQRRRQLA